MRIVYLTESPIPSYAANTVQVMQMCAAFARAGHDLTLVCRPAEEAELRIRDPFEFYAVAKSFSAIHIRKGTGPGSAALWGLRAGFVAIRKRAELVYGRSLLGCSWAARLGKPTVFEAHKPLNITRKKSQARARSFFESKNLVRVVLLSRQLEEVFTLKTEELLGRPFPALSAKTHVALNGAEPPEVASSGATASLGILPTEGQLKVGYAGALYLGKGMEIIAEIAPSLPEILFCVAGGPEKETERWREQTHAVSNIVLLGHIEQHRLPDFRSSMDIILVPPKRHVQVAGSGVIDQALAPPLKLFEALAAGRAVICSAYLDEVVNDGEHALLCDPERPQEWVRAIRRLAQDPEQRRELGKRGSKLVRDSYSWSARAARVLSGIDT